MKMGMKGVALTSALAIGLMFGNVMAQTETDTTVSSGQAQQKTGKMMQGMQGQSGMGMMGGKGMMQGQGGKGMMMQGKMGCMKMMGQGMGMMGGGMMGGGMMKNMSAENQIKFMDATREMRKEMHLMRFEHMEAMRNPKTSLEDLAAMEQKMLDSRKKMMKKAKTFQEPEK